MNTKGGLFGDRGPGDAFRVKNDPPSTPVLPRQVFEEPRLTPFRVGVPKYVDKRRSSEEPGNVVWFGRHGGRGPSFVSVLPVLPRRLEEFPGTEVSTKDPWGVPYASSTSELMSST